MFPHKKNIQDTQIKLDVLCRVWQIATLISGKKYNRVPAVNGSDLMAY